MRALVSGLAALAVLAAGCSIGPVSILPDEIAVHSECTFEIKTRVEQDLEQICQQAGRVETDGGPVGIIYGAGLRGARVNMLVVDGDKVTADGPGVIETSSSGNVIVIIYELEEIFGSTPVDLRIDDEAQLQCDLDSVFRIVFSGVCEDG